MKTDKNEKGYMNQLQASYYLGISKRILLKLYRDGKIIGHKKGYKTILFEQKELDNWVKNARQ